ncbi:hypothetical protein P261_01886 [Lachnospiraceae bacterium TWA4]|nr:hypothetical protein P261_01886 [Lachnospiraceae bacterium TWA4]
MKYHIDMAYKSINQYGEELCGDKVELITTDHSHIMILVDGLGSGVKASILSSMTSKILATMLINGESIDECIDTVLSTLPYSEEHEAYTSFGVLAVDNSGRAYLAEFGDLHTLCMRNYKRFDLPRTERTIDGKVIREAHFDVELGDTYAMISSGCFISQIDQLSYWSPDQALDFIEDCLKKTHASKRLANQIVQESCDYYGQESENDLTAAVFRVRNRHITKLMTGPPSSKDLDEEAVKTFMEGKAFRIVSGGSTAEIVSRIIGYPVIPIDDPHPDPKIPPMSSIKTIQLVTEGVITLSRVVELLEEYIKREELDEKSNGKHEESDEEFYLELDKKNGASLIASRLIENCTDFDMIIGQAINPAYQDANLSFDLAARKQLCTRIEELMIKLGKKVTTKYY